MSKQFYLDDRLNKVFNKNKIIKDLRFSFGFKKFFSWARPWICPFEKFIFSIPNNKSVFDIGCGDGVFLYLIAILRKPKILYGVDVIDTDLDAVKTVFKRVKYKKISTFLDWPEDKFDVVTVIDVLHHIKPEEQSLFVKKTIDKINPGGTLIIKDMNTRPFFCAFMNILHDLIFAKQLIKYFSFEKLKNIIEENGLIIQEVDSKIIFWYSHKWVIAKKNN